MTLVWSRPAIVDRREVRLFIAQENPAAALAFDARISTKAGRLLEHPGLGHVGRIRDTRELVIHPNYVLVYAIVGDQVQILRLLHAARIR